jgi:ParB-like nuclease domain
MEKVTDVLLTGDYSMFKTIKGNRTLNQINLNLIKKSMKLQQLMSPILVNEHYEIIDGQHRFEACKALKLPVYYIMQKNYGLTEVQRLNVHSKNWNLVDYIDSYAFRGYEAYEMLRDFHLKYKFSISECITLLGTTASRPLHALRDGTFMVGDYDKAIERADKICAVGDFYDGYKRRAFVCTMIHLFENEEYNHDHFLAQLGKQPSKLTNCFTMKDYLHLIESIYNFQHRTKVRLF